MIREGLRVARHSFLDRDRLMRHLICGSESQDGNGFIESPRGSCESKAERESQTIRDVYGRYGGLLTRFGRTDLPGQGTRPSSGALFHGSHQRLTKSNALTGSRTWNDRNYRVSDTIPGRPDSLSAALAISAGIAFSSDVRLHKVGGHPKPYFNLRAPAVALGRQKGD